MIIPRTWYKIKLNHFFTILSACLLFYSVVNLNSQSIAPAAATNSLVLSIVQGQSPDTLEVSWNTTAGKTYQLEFSTNLINWLDLGPPVSGGGDKIIATEYPHNTQTFYRVRSD
jgi:hypothetical protein